MDDLAVVGKVVGLAVLVMVGFVVVVVVGLQLFRKVMEPLVESMDEDDTDYGGGNWLWPKIVNTRVAVRTARHSAYAAFLVAAFTAVLSAFQMWGASRLGLIDAAVFLLLGLGIKAMWRSAAVLALALYSLEQILAVVTRLSIPNLAISIIFILYFINGIRATFAYQKVKVLPESQKTETPEEPKEERDLTIA